MSNKYRKKPVVVTAVQFLPDKEIYPEGVYKYLFPNEGYEFRVDTLEGYHVASPGDWIITGIKGEKYPCKPDIFEATYEKVEE